MAPAKIIVPFIYPPLWDHRSGPNYRTTYPPAFILVLILVRVLVWKRTKPKLRIQLKTKRRSCSNDQPDDLHRLEDDRRVIAVKNHIDNPSERNNDQIVADETHVRLSRISEQGDSEKA